MPRKATAPCGTEAAYRRHQRHGETPCEECKRAAAQRRAERRGVKKPAKADQPMRELMEQLIDAVRRDPAGKIDYSGEYQRLYGYLNAALPAAMPREVASIVKEMRAILLDLRTLDVKDGAGNAAELQQQFAATVAQLNDDDDDGDL